MPSDGSAAPPCVGRDSDAPTLLRCAAKQRFSLGQGEDWLWAGTFVLSLFLIGRAIQQLLEWPRALADADASHLVHQMVVWLGVIAVFSAGRWSVLFVLSFIAHRRTLRRPLPEPSEWPFVSIIVPCFNEEHTIGPALESLLTLDYPEYEVIVIDDGSTDNTQERAGECEGDHAGCSVRVYHKPNGGKWTALNFGFRLAKGEFILCVDADSRIAPGSLKSCVVHMQDPTVSAVAGQVRVRNRDTLITRLQALEYVTGNGSTRLSQALSHTVMVVPGPIGLFRASVLHEVWRTHGDESPGPFEGDTFAEDFDVSVAILCLGGRIAYEPNAISYTKAPDRLFTFINQRYRWIRGSLQVLKKLCRRATTEPVVVSAPLLAWTVLVYLPDAFFVPLATVMAPVVSLALFVNGVDLRPLFDWYAASLVLQAGAGAFFVAVHRDRLATLTALPALGLYGSFVILCAWLISIVDEVRGAPMRW